MALLGPLMPALPLLASHLLRSMRVAQVLDAVLAKGAVTLQWVPLPLAPYLVMGVLPILELCPF